MNYMPSFHLTHSKSFIRPFHSFRRIQSINQSDTSQLNGILIQNYSQNHFRLRTEQIFQSNFVCVKMKYSIIHDIILLLITYTIYFWLGRCRFSQAHYNQSNFHFIILKQCNIKNYFDGIQTKLFAQNKLHSPNQQ